MARSTPTRCSLRAIVYREKACRIYKLIAQIAAKLEKVTSNFASVCATLSMLDCYCALFTGEETLYLSNQSLTIEKGILVEGTVPILQCIWHLFLWMKTRFWTHILFKAILFSSPDKSCLKIKTLTLRLNSEWPADIRVLDFHLEVTHQGDYHNQKYALLAFYNNFYYSQQNFNYIGSV